MLFECMGIYILNLAHESEMRGYLVYLLIVKYVLILFKFSCSMLEWMAYCGTLGGIFFNIYRGVCGPYYLQGLYRKSALIYEL